MPSKCSPNSGRNTIYELRTHPEADAELEDVLRYLKENTLHQATRFADLLHEALIRIRQNPKSCHFIHQNYRCCHLRPFSHSIIYGERLSDVYVIDLMHDKRQPDYWKARITDEQD